MSYDVVVVGGGSSGSVLAARLSTDPERTVLLVEAGVDVTRHGGEPTELATGFGGSLDLMTTPYVWRWAVRPTREGEDATVFTGRALGGGSAVNGQIFVRAPKEDFDDWAARGNPAWSYEHALAAYVRTERDEDFSGPAHGRGGPIPVRRIPRDQWSPTHEAFAAACIERGFGSFEDINAPGVCGVGPTAFNNLEGRRYGVAQVYLDPARDRPNLTVRTGTRATSIRLRGTRATGVELAVDGTTEFVEANEVICCAGAIGSAQLLALSGVGPAPELHKAGIPVAIDLPVGKSLRDHPQVRLAYYADRDPERDGPAPRGPVRLLHTSAAGAKTNDLLLAPISPWIGRTGFGDHDRGRQLGFQLVVTLEQPVGHGRLSVRSSDVGEAPLIEMNFLEEAEDRARLREGIELALELAAGAGYRRLHSRRADPEDEHLANRRAIDRWARATVMSCYHLTSTCPMGPESKADTVVDERGLVHGLDNVRVADASVMPDVVRANPNATAIMLGERMADLISGSY